MELIKLLYISEQTTSYKKHNGFIKNDTFERFYMEKQKIDCKYVLLC